MPSKDKYGSVNPKRGTFERFERFRWSLAGRRKGKVTHDDALAELLKKAGY